MIFCFQRSILYQFALNALFGLALLQSHQGSQRTNFGRVCVKPGLPAPEAILDDLFTSIKESYGGPLPPKIQEL